MEFHEVLTQVLDLLQRQGRVSYGALKRRFKLDDHYLEELKTKIIEAQQLGLIPTNTDTMKRKVTARYCYIRYCRTSFLWMKEY